MVVDVEDPNTRGRRCKDIQNLLQSGHSGHLPLLIVDLGGDLLRQQNTEVFSQLGSPLGDQKEKPGVTQWNLILPPLPLGEALEAAGLGPV